jgi:hypothetical protein
LPVAGYLLASLIGVSLGLIGGGGSILTIPVLVYIFKVDPFTATSYSLFIVGITSLYGSYRHYRLGNLEVKPALFFAVPSLLSLLITRNLLMPRIPGLVLRIGELQLTRNMLIMLVFSVLMIVVSYLMIRKNEHAVKATVKNNFRLGIMGFLIGFFTGFLGAGGGFVIIPALVFFAGLPMKQAVGTSLLIIAINSLIGFGVDLVHHISPDYPLLLGIASMAMAGMFVGTFLSTKIDGRKLKPAFGWFVLLMGIWIIIKEFFMN